LILRLRSGQAARLGAGSVVGVCTVRQSCRSASLPRSLGARSFCRLGRRQGRLARLPLKCVAPLACPFGATASRRAVLGLHPPSLTLRRIPLPALGSPSGSSALRAEASSSR